jgi:hypothetical protein
MIEDEKRRIAGMGDVEGAKLSMERSKEIAMKRIPKIDVFGRAYATGQSLMLPAAPNYFSFYPLGRVPDFSCPSIPMQGSARQLLRGCG